MPSLAFVDGLPLESQREAAYAGVTAPQFDSAGWRAVLEGVRKFHDRGAAEKFEDLAWQGWGRVAPDEAKVAAASLGDSEARLRAALSLLSVGNVLSSQVENADGSTTSSYQTPDDRAERVAAVLEAANVAGVPRREALRRAFSALGSNTLENDGVRYLLEAREGTELDLSLVRAASRSLNGALVSSWDVDAFLAWAKEIREPQLRRRVIRGGLRRRLWAAPDGEALIRESAELDDEGSALFDELAGDEF